MSCANCFGPHAASSKNCPKYQQSKDILKIKTEKKCSMRDAIKIYRTQNPPQVQNLSTFANRIKENENSTAISAITPNSITLNNNSTTNSSTENENIKSSTTTTSTNSERITPSTENKKQQSNKPEQTTTNLSSILSSIEERIMKNKNTENISTLDVPNCTMEIDTPTTTSNIGFVTHGNINNDSYSSTNLSLSNY
ncbi:PREDICTED: TBC1 domain family member 5 homolog B-like [Rhagoletis zephyria]|uniref:TBC1 domain family member 5 homolog B-like n=1 Tax=Rhagoletis zephyria TaxID=28612 RepID=UPI0008114988|nr:PREDICTED: TBC1 domain family member 5 homolog B-like [Rhagoletis zephyria]